jgi:hypothetical protein
VILPFFRQAVGFRSLSLCSIYIPAVQVEVSGIHQDRSGSSVMMMTRINFTGPAKKSQSILTNFQVSGMVGPSGLAGLRPME